MTINMKTQTFETSKGTLMAIRLDSGEMEPHIFNDYKTNPNWNSYISYFLNHETKRFYLPPGDWKEIGLWGSVSEEKAKEVVESFEFTSWGRPIIKHTSLRFVNYQSEAPFNNSFSTALESLQSLLETQIKLRNPLGKRPPNAINRCYLSQLEITEELNKWQTSEAEVWKHFYLIFKTK